MSEQNEIAVLTLSLDGHGFTVPFDDHGAILEELRSAAEYESCDGQPYLALPWPTDAPAPWNDPGCALREWSLNGMRATVDGIPRINGIGRWAIPVYASGHRYTPWLSDLTPADEPKCETCGQSEPPVICGKCGRAVLSDRRKEQRRQGERRVANRSGLRFVLNRRSGTDRRGDR